MTSNSNIEFLNFAFDTAQKAGTLSLQYFRQRLDIGNKKADRGFDPVTIADKAVEASIRADIIARYPEHGILGEEQQELLSSSDYRWVIDPIDGTRAFISGVPAWGVLLGLQYQQDNIVGLMHQPYTEETFFACDGQASFVRGADLSKAQTIRCSHKTALEDATLYCTHPSIFDDFGNALERFERVADAVQLMRYGGDCYSYCLLAMGQIDLVIEADLQPYDIIPLIPIVEAAGGLVTDWHGGAATAGGLVIAAATKELHAAALGKLNG